MNNKLIYIGSNIPDKTPAAVKFSFEYWFGVRDWYSVAEKLDGSSSYKIIVLKNGMLFLIVYCLFFLLYAFLYNKRDLRDFILFAIVFISCTYQRTNLYNVLYLFLFCYYARFASEISIHNKLVHNEKNTLRRRICDAK